MNSVHMAQDGPRNTVIRFWETQTAGRFLFNRIEVDCLLSAGHAVVQLIETLRFKPKGRGFDSRWCHWNLSLLVESNQPLT